ncbi:hypothetical protein QVD17_10322 [Tagetes erecta]|uniref:mannan endo-1,4-beta-mannosidase n=1 Tax=Tagetes erecta TaxID=13708 RepID=A0AAD8P637_TARER|nr:hypothetical protein QVD17_10322 [Tagetes erecta]
MATYIPSSDVIFVAFILYASLLGCICEPKAVKVGEGESFVQIKEANFVINGSPFLFNGFNAYWMMNVATDSSERYKVTQVLQIAANAGLSVCRTWAFADGADNKALQVSPGVYNERAFQGLDFVVAEARKHGIRLILSFVNNYKDFGGRPQYVEWARSSGVQVHNDDDFYTNPVVKGYYKNHVKEWVKEMAAFVKSLDRGHLLEIGLEGFYGDTTPKRKQINPGYQVGTDFISNNLVKEIDFATIHAYPDQWLSGQNEDTQMAFMQRWMSSHYEDSRTVLKKPLVIAEFGKSNKDRDYNINKRDSYMNDVYRNIYAEAKSGGMVGGGLVWQLVADGMGAYGDGYEIILSKNPSTDGIISQQSHAMTTLSRLLGSDELLAKNVLVNHGREIGFDQLRGTKSSVANHRHLRKTNQAHNRKRLRNALP